MSGDSIGPWLVAKFLDGYLLVENSVSLCDLKILATFLCKVATQWTHLKCNTKKFNDLVGSDIGNKHYYFLKQTSLEVASVVCLCLQ